MKFGIGQPAPRREDPRFLTGQGCYTADITREGMAHAFVVRSPHAHARIVSVDTEAAHKAKGVLLVAVGQDIKDAGIADIPCMAAGMLSSKDGTPCVNVGHPALAREHVRHVGDGVVLIVAETYAQAEDAAALVDVVYEPLPCITDTKGALDAKAPQVWDAHKNNLVLDWEIGDEAAAKTALDKASHKTHLNLVNNRVVVNAMEPRAALAEYTEAEGFTLHTGTQGVHLVQGFVAGAVLQIPPDKLRVITPDVGGGFGMKAFIYPDYILVLFAARALKRPVKWVATRSDSFLTDTQGRDHVTEAELALDKEGHILGLKIDTIANMGAYLSQYAPMIPTAAGAGMHVGVYNVPAFHNRVRCVFTHTPPIDAYRGAGRPEASYLIERLMDAAAREMKIAPDELRRRNFMTPGSEAKTPAATLPIDSGDFTRVMDDALARAGAGDFEARRKAARAEGKRLGLGISYYVERTAPGGTEHARVSVDTDGRVHLYAGTQSTGQGHETAWAQILCERLGVAPEAVVFHGGDTAALPGGGGTGGSRSLYAAAGAIGEASDALIKEGTDKAANLFDAKPENISFVAGSDATQPHFALEGSNRTIDLFALARELGSGDDTMPLDATATGTTPGGSYPNGCHICEVEIDEATGVLRIPRYTVADDFGKIVNPLLVSGQVEGGIVQGLGQALCEEAVFDPQSGQMLTGSFMDYQMPRASDMPYFDVNYHEIPCGQNPGGIKGCGEAGTVGAPAALVNAAVDALSEFGITHLDMPLTPRKLWHAMKDSKAR